ncbi:MAG: efflux RND transporter periplasmic adaptor subunit [Nitrospirota bacterium]
MKKISLVIVFCLLFTVFCLLFSGGCTKKESAITEERIANVRVQAAEEISLRPFIEAVGSLNPYDEVIVSAEIDGILKNVNVDEGTTVSKGTILATINDTDYRLEVKRAEASLKQAEATLSNTKLEYQRKEALYKEQLITQQQFDDVSARLSIAEAEIESAKANLSIAEERLRKTEICSPIAGVINERKISAGDYVKNGGSLFVIVQNNPIKLNFAVTERDVGRVKKGQDIILSVDALPGREFKGNVSIIYPVLDERTRTLQVEAIIPNAGEILKAGIFARVTLYTGKEEKKIVVPVTALLYEAEKVKLFVVEGDRVKERFVKTGLKYGEMMEIIEGIKKGEKVVVVGQQNLSEGVKVNIVSTKD